MVSVPEAESSLSRWHHLALWASHCAVESSCGSTPGLVSPDQCIEGLESHSNAWKDWGPLTGSLRKTLFRMYRLSGESAASGESPPETDILTTHLHLQDLCMESERDSKGTQPVLKEFLARMRWGPKQGSFAEQNGAAELGAGPKQGPQMVFPWKFTWRSCSLTGQQHAEVTSSSWSQAAFCGSQAWEQVVRGKPHCGRGHGAEYTNSMFQCMTESRCNPVYCPADSPVRSGNNPKPFE